MTTTMTDLLNSMRQIYTKLKEMHVKLLPNQSAAAEGTVKTASEYLCHFDRPEESSDFDLSL